MNKIIKINKYPGRWTVERETGRLREEENYSVVERDEWWNLTTMQVILSALPRTKAVSVSLCAAVSGSSSSPATDIASWIRKRETTSASHCPLLFLHIPSLRIRQTGRSPQESKPLSSLTLSVEESLSLSQSLTCSL